MKKIVDLFFLLALTTAVLAQDSIDESTPVVTKESCTLTLELTGIDSDEGQLMVGLYDSEDSWLNNNFKGELAKISDGKATVVFSEIPYGIYGASVVHDKDMNNKLNTGMFGIPSEPYASSRGAKGKFGPPKWADAKFELSSETATEVIKF